MNFLLGAGPLALLDGREFRGSVVFLGREEGLDNAHVSQSFETVRFRLNIVQDTAGKNRRARGRIGRVS
jgi:hypothetical protein